jgi:1-phosphofructokinase family hexose kinase
VIVAAGLSPAWQQILVLDRLSPGAVNRAREAYWCASGKVLNVGLALHHLSGGDGSKTLTISTLGGAAYEPIDREFHELGVPRHWIRTQSPTRVCTTLIDRLAGVATELIENAGPATADELAEFEAAFAKAAALATAVVLTGSLPTGAPTDFYCRLLSHIDCPAVLDIRGAELLAALEARPFLVKPNRDELANTLGKPIANDDELRGAIDELQRQGAQSVVVTSGKYCLWLGTAGEFHRLTPPPVDNIINPIGCGDCLAAGIAWTIGQGGDVESAVRAGMDLASKNLCTLLPSDFDGRRERLARR